MDNRLNVLVEVDDLDQYFVHHQPLVGISSPEYTLYDTESFIRWSESAKHQLRKLKSSDEINEIIKLLDSFDGWDDESKLRKLQAKIHIILDHPEDFLPEESESMKESERLTKGIIIHTAFDDYELINQIGQGGNGKVFCAKDSDGNDVAIKFVERDESGKKYKRLKNEINFCEKHNHKNIIKIIDRGIEFFDGKAYVFYIMPKYEKTLRDKIKEGIAAQEAISIFVGIMEGLKYAHEHGSIHRDIKPENILFNEESDTPVICDFGIAHFAEDELYTLVDTKPGDRLANFQYAAPEQRVKGGAKRVTERADVFSAALILNEMFTKQIPQSSGYQKIADVNPEYAFLDVLFEKLFRQNPDDRLYPVDKVITELNALVSIHQNKKEKQKLEQLTYNALESKEINISIIDKRFQNGELIFKLNQKPPQKWNSILKSGEYSHSSTLRVDPSRISVELDWLILTMLDPRDVDIKSAVKMIPEWISATNEKYNEMQRIIARKEQQKKEKEREQKLRTIEQENRINTLLADL
ncbi:MAG: serine/threonine-protein kinase [Ruminococcus sp.]|nr:serine/threonine-protein kinase [Ruminococcus sp.]